MRLLTKGRKFAGLMAVMLVLVSMLAGCGSQSNVGQVAWVPKPGAQVVKDPYTAIQQAADQFLKQNRPLTISAQEVYEKIMVGGDQSYLLVDVRADEHYAKAHIPGAIHIAYADIWREDKIKFLPADKKIVVICYSGHTASQVAALWGMLGYDAIAMKNGMSAWTRDREAIGASPLACAPNQYPVVPGIVEGKEFDHPQLDLKQAASVADVLLQQAEAIVDRPVVIQPKDLLEKLPTSEYYVVDLREKEHYQKGHIQGAVNIPFRALAQTENLKKIPSDKQVVLVCYDGHAASQAARILNQAGYNTTALKDGMSVWTSDESIIGAKVIACNVVENPVVVLNAVLSPGASAAAT